MTEPKPKRRPMTPARKRRIHAGQNGLCGCGCGQLVDVEGPDVRYDHSVEFWLRPDLDDDGPNVKAVRTECDKPKTYGPGGSIPRIAKTKRQSAMRLDVPREPSRNPIPSRGFAPGHRPLKSANTFATRRKP